MTATLLPATITPFDARGRTLDPRGVVIFDFNPESIQFQTSSGQEADRGRQGRQQLQHVAKTHATIRFDAVFDTTRPNPERQPPGSGTGEESLDVRGKTSRLANLVRDEPSRRNRAPRRVQFQWGAIVFNGVLTEFSETFEFFSPGGVPLRSKVSVTITEQEFRYQVAPSLERPTRAGSVAGDAGDLARSNDLDDLDDLFEGSGFKVSAGLSAQVDIDANVQDSLGIEASRDAVTSSTLGVSEDINVELRSGTDLGLTSAIEVFGADPVIGARAATAPRLLRDPGTDRSPSADQPPTAWGPGTAVTGDRGAALAGVVAEARARGRADDFGPTGFSPDPRETQRSATRRGAPSIAGTPPTRLPAFGPAIASLAPMPAVDRRGAGALSGRIPSWERLAVPLTAPDPRNGTARCCSSSACGCSGCRARARERNRW